MRPAGRVRRPLPRRLPSRADRPGSDAENPPAATPDGGQEAEEPEPTYGPEDYPGQNIIRDMYGDMEERAEEYAPKVTTLENGVQIQRTPTEYYAGIYHNPGATISYNTFYLDADNAAARPATRT